MAARPPLKYKIRIGAKKLVAAGGSDSGATAVRSGSSSPRGGAARTKHARVRALLAGFPKPSEAGAIVSCLAALGAPFANLPTDWDKGLALSPALADFAVLQEGGVVPQRVAKKRRRGADAEGAAPQRRRTAEDIPAAQAPRHGAVPPVDEDGGVGPSAADTASPSDERQAHLQAGANLHVQTPMPRMETKSTPVNDLVGAGGVGRPPDQQTYGDDRPATKGGAGDPEVGPHGSSTSDEANNRSIPSPDGPGSENIDKLGSAAAGSGSAAAGPGSAAAAAAAAAVAAEAQRSGPPRPSIACQAGTGALVQPSTLHSLGGCSAAAAALYSIGPFDLLMPGHSRQHPTSVDEKYVHAHLDKARTLKHSADKARGSTSAPWTVAALCTYVESAVTFMEACEYYARCSTMKAAERVHRAAALYASTAQLLQYITKTCECAMGPDLGREALRVLSERLSVVCHMKEALHAGARLGDASAKAAALASHITSVQVTGNVSSRPVGPSGASRHGGGGSGAPPHHGAAVVGSTDDSTNSSPAAGGHIGGGHAGSSAAAQHAALPLPSGDTLTRLLDTARTVSRFSSLARRTTLGFQGFIERPDLRESQASKCASMHIAAVSFDCGMGDGFRTLAHARQAVASIQESILEMDKRAGGGQYYKRPLPCPPAVEFSSSEGRAVFAEALAAGTAISFFNLVEQFNTQAEPAFCGLASLTMVLNALSIDPQRTWKGAWRWFDERMLDCCVPLDEVERDGISLEQAACLGRCNGARVNTRPAGSFTLEEFRAEVVACCSSDPSKQTPPDRHVIVNYSRRSFKQTGDGHFSPIGAYHPGRDLILILDTARFKYPPHWVPLATMFTSMSTGTGRGFIVVSEQPWRNATMFTLAMRSRQWEQAYAFVKLQLLALLAASTVAGTDAGGAGRQAPSGALLSSEEVSTAPPAAAGDKFSGSAGKEGGEGAAPPAAIDDKDGGAGGEEGGGAAARAGLPWDEGTRAADAEARAAVRAAVRAGPRDTLGLFLVQRDCVDGGCCSGGGSRAYAPSPLPPPNRNAAAAAAAPDHGALLAEIRRMPLYAAVAEALREEPPPAGGHRGALPTSLPTPPAATPAPRPSRSGGGGMACGGAAAAATAEAVGGGAAAAAGRVGGEGTLGRRCSSRDDAPEVSPSGLLAEKYMLLLLLNPPTEWPQGARQSSVAAMRQLLDLEPYPLVCAEVAYLRQQFEHLTSLYPSCRCVGCEERVQRARITSQAK
ncbi:hypothetical protein FOA52_013926 [Chlamydomonas sp. UWO 241]|nr:hypothetical protein FOA52_013926 [Chlamydomonas sp. UWO 241]